jgi:hypothetical protein
VLDRRPTDNPNYLGKWAVLWASREGVFSVKVAEKTDEFLSVEVTATVDFDPDRDYLVCDEHEEQRVSFGTGVKETWKLVTLAGTAPMWVIFPTAWQEWVADTAVTNSAVKFILSYVPEARPEIDAALAVQNKVNKMRAWESVLNIVNHTLSVRWRERISVGEIKMRSWTDILAVPARLAKRIGEFRQATDWVPPKPKPDYQHPDDSGRFALANLYGIFPKRGPGIDHNTQDRARDNREGELRRSSGRFSSRRGEPAIPSA